MKKLLMFTLAILIAAGCSSSGERGTASSERSFLFGMRSDTTGAEDFIAATSDPDVISMVLLELQKADAERTLMINGAIDRGNKGNKNWSWHFKSEDWALAEISVEECDGLPSDVEQNLDYWVDTVKRFCPWTSFVKEEVVSN